MGELVRRRWSARFEGMSRRDRKGCDYDAYVPDPLQGWRLDLPADLAADIADAEAAVRALNDAGTSHVGLEGLARFLLRAESVASSRIEGLQVGPRRLLDAEVAVAHDSEATHAGTRLDHTAVEVLGNIRAMESAVEAAVEAGTFGIDELLAVHRLLMDASSHPGPGGRLREEQNWIGGSNYNPCSAAFVPPPPERVGPLLDDLFAYIDGDEHSPLVQAALAHAQFETIHPFADGNGRAGRALIHVVLRRRGLAPGFVPPISLVLATWSDDYVGGLNTYRYVGAAGAPERSAAAHRWLRVMAVATARACADAEGHARRIDVLTAGWRERLGAVRSGSATDRLLAVLPGAPVVTVESAARLIGRSTVRTGDAVNRLADAGVLRQRNLSRRRYRVFEAGEVVSLFTSLERRLANPVGDTALGPPSRPVPRR